MIYSDLIINTKNWGHIFNTWKNNRLPHALLFHGPAGIGKEGHAIELAALLNCVDIQDKHACGICPSCKKIISFQHECVKLILPLPRGKIASSNDSSIKAFKKPKDPVIFGSSISGSTVSSRIKNTEPLIIFSLNSIFIGIIVDI